MKRLKSGRETTTFSKLAGMIFMYSKSRGTSHIQYIYQFQIGFISPIYPFIKFEKYLGKKRPLLVSLEKNLSPKFTQIKLN